MKNQFFILIIFTAGCQLSNDSSVSHKDDIEVANRVIKENESTKNKVVLSEIIQNQEHLSDEYSHYPIKFPDNVSRQDYLRDQTAFDAFQRLNIVLNISSLADLDLGVRNFLEQHKSDYYHFQLAQWASLVMLDKKLTYSDESVESKEKIAFYIQKLLDYNYNHSYVISKSLPVLEGYWDRTKIKEAAEKCLNNTINSKHSMNEEDVEGNTVLRSLIQ
jgi:hypothetical protein